MTIVRKDDRDLIKKRRKRGKEKRRSTIREENDRKNSMDSCRFRKVRLDDMTSEGKLALVTNKGGNRTGKTKKNGLGGEERGEMQRKKRMANCKLKDYRGQRQVAGGY